MNADFTAMALVRISHTTISFGDLYYSELYRTELYRSISFYICYIIRRDGKLAVSELSSLEAVAKCMHGHLLVVTRLDLWCICVEYGWMRRVSATGSWVGNVRVRMSWRPDRPASGRGPGDVRGATHRLAVGRRAHDPVDS